MRKQKEWKCFRGELWDGHVRWKELRVEEGGGNGGRKRKRRGSSRARRSGEWGQGTAANAEAERALVCCIPGLGSWPFPPFVPFLLHFLTFLATFHFFSIHIFCQLSMCFRHLTGWQNSLNFKAYHQSNVDRDSEYAFSRVFKFSDLMRYMIF